jgi:hypothetical protein
VTTAGCGALIPQTSKAFPVDGVAEFLSPHNRPLPLLSGYLCQDKDSAAVLSQAETAAVSKRRRENMASLMLSLLFLRSPEHHNIMGDICSVSVQARQSLVCTLLINDWMGALLPGAEGRELVAHTCNSSYAGGSNQEDHGLKPAWASNSSQDTISKIPLTKKGWWSGSR